MLSPGELYFYLRKALGEKSGKVNICWSFWEVGALV